MRSFYVRIQTSDGCDFCTWIKAYRLEYLNEAVMESYPEAVGVQLLSTR